MADIPHFALPFRFAESGGKLVAVVTEQGSPEEIFDSAHAIIRYRKGDRDDLPDFGLTDQLFREGGFDLDVVQSEVEEWEPRAQTVVSNQDAIKELFERVRVEIRSREEPNA